MNPPDQPPSSRNRVVALINPVLHCRSTCAELIGAGVNLVGIVEAKTKTGGLPIATFRRQARRHGFKSALSQVAARLAYLATNRKADREIYRSLFDADQISAALNEWSGRVVECGDYSEPHVLSQLTELQPDILVVHSQSWVPKKIREVPSTGLVIGGHPGITPNFRGSHSSFWALLNQQPEMIGWTTFHVDKGVDTGDVIVQGRLDVEENDSFMSLNWRGMKHIAKAQAEAIQQFVQTGEVNRLPHQEITPDSDFGLPGLGDYIRYRRSQSVAR